MAADVEKLRAPRQENYELDLLKHVKEVAPAGNPVAAIAAIDKYAWTGGIFFMNVGDVKGLILDKALQQANPFSALELGAFCGYSALRISSQLSKPGARLVSVELSKERAANAAALIAHAGLSHRVSFVVGTLQTATEAVRDAAVKVPFDFVFIDHDKTWYLSDLLFLRDQGLIGPGSVIVADNILYPGAPDYLAFMDSATDFKTEKHDTVLEYSQAMRDLVLVSTFEPRAAE